MLWGEFPWEEPPPQIGKLISTGAVARTTTRALQLLGDVVPYRPHGNQAGAAEHAALAAFLSSIDLLWADLYPGSGAVLRVRRELGLPIPALLYAGGVMPKGAEAMLRPWQQLLAPYDQLLLTCAADLAIWQRLVRRSALGAWVVPLAVDDTLFRPRTSEERSAARALYGIPPDAALLLYVGRLNIQKNLHSLLRLFAAVRHQVPRAHLCLTGASDDIVLGEFGVSNTGYVPWLRKLATELGIAEHISFTGARSGEALAQIYAAADVLVNLSIYHRENFGLAQAEAQLCGLPVVCTAWGGFKDVVREGETGFLIDAVLTRNGIRVDWARGAERVTGLLANTALRARMAEQARLWATQRFSAAAMSTALAPAVRAARTASTAHASAPAYEPSRFAQLYEAHKRRCGWYATPGQRAQRWFPRMFQGREYALYERLIGPYATYRAERIRPAAIRREWLVYPPAPLTFDPLRRLALAGDPIWPQQCFVEQIEWDVLTQAGQPAYAGTLLDSLTAQGYTAEAVLAALSKLAIEGMIILSAG